MENIKDNDASEEEFNENYRDMPWLAVPFGNNKEIEELQEIFKVDGIPALVIINENWEVVSAEGVKEVSKNHKKPQKLLQFWKDLNSKKEEKEIRKPLEKIAQENKGFLKKKCFFWF